MSDLEPLLRDRFERVRDYLDAALAAGTPRGKGRGTFRRELTMSVARLRTLQIDPEAPRTRKSKKPWSGPSLPLKTPNDDWHNQFNPANGIGPDRRNRQSVDIVHDSATRELMFLDFLELKRWDNRENDPLSAALGSHLRHPGRTPLRTVSLALRLLARTVSLSRWYPALATCTRELLHQFRAVCSLSLVSSRVWPTQIARSAARPEFSSLALVQFSATPVVLGPSITRLGFAGHFDQDEVKLQGGQQKKCRFATGACSSQKLRRATCVGHRSLRQRRSFPDSVLLGESGSWSHEMSVPETDIVSYFERHIVPLVFTFTRGGQTHRFHVTAFVLSVGGQWFLVTAGHCLAEVDELSAEHGYTLEGCCLVDSLGLNVWISPRFPSCTPKPNRSASAMTSISTTV